VSSPHREVIVVGPAVGDDPDGHVVDEIAVEAGERLAS
jgi:hypothetical protein